MLHVCSLLRGNLLGESESEKKVFYLKIRRWEIQRSELSLNMASGKGRRDSQELKWHGDVEIVRDIDTDEYTKTEER